MSYHNSLVSKNAKTPKRIEISRTTVDSAGTYEDTWCLAMMALSTFYQSINAPSFQEERWL